MLAVTLINAALVSAAVVVHYEILYRLSQLVPKLKLIKRRYRIVVGIFGALCAHTIEIWLFAFGYYFMLHWGGFGSLEGNFDGSLLDCSYFSFTVYTSLGFGDIEPLGLVRFLTGLEALTGLVLITWTASFLFIEMQRLWRQD